MIETAKILVALATPLCLALFFPREEVRRFAGIFTAGLFAAFAAIHINTFLVDTSGMAVSEAIVKLTPITEEILKALPVFLYLLAEDNPKRDKVVGVALTVGMSFATFENCFLLVKFGGESLMLTLIRSLAAGLMHISCAVFLGYGLSMLLEHRYMLIPGVLGLLCVLSVLHATYNLLVTAASGWPVAGYALPFIIAAALILWQRCMEPDAG